MCSHKILMDVAKVSRSRLGRLQTAPGSASRSAACAGKPPTSAIGPGAKLGRQQTAFGKLTCLLRQLCVALMQTSISPAEPFCRRILGSVETCSTLAEVSHAANHGFGAGAAAVADRALPASARGVLLEACLLVGFGAFCAGGALAAADNRAISERGEPICGSPDAGGGRRVFDASVPGAAGVGGVRAAAPVGVASVVSG